MRSWAPDDGEVLSTKRSCASYSGVRKFIILLLMLTVESVMSIQKRKRPEAGFYRQLSAQSLHCWPLRGRARKHQTSVFGCNRWGSPTKWGVQGEEACQWAYKAGNTLSLLLSLITDTKTLPSLTMDRNRILQWHCTCILYSLVIRCQVEAYFSTTLSWHGRVYINIWCSGKGPDVRKPPGWGKKTLLVQQFGK